jgi:hypothetical protein
MKRGDGDETRIYALGFVHRDCGIFTGPGGVYLQMRGRQRAGDLHWRKRFTAGLSGHDLPAIAALGCARQPAGRAVRLKGQMPAGTDLRFL